MNSFPPKTKNDVFNFRCLHRNQLCSVLSRKQSRLSSGQSIVLSRLLENSDTSATRPPQHSRVTAIRIYVKEYLFKKYTVLLSKRLTFDGEINFPALFLASSRLRTTFVNGVRRRPPICCICQISLHRSRVQQAL